MRRPDLDHYALTEYRPSPDEEYMSDRQLAYFERKLMDWKQELMLETQSTIDEMRQAEPEVGDEVDHATRMDMQNLELRTRERYTKLLHKIDEALQRIHDGSYGYCEFTGEPIGVERLEARPVATLSLFAQEIKEKRERADLYRGVHFGA